MRMLKLFRVLLAPLGPEGDDDSLQDASQGRGEKRSPDAEEFGPSDQSEQRYNWMQADSLSNDARSDQFTLNDVNDHEIDQNSHRDQPAVRETDYYAERARNDGSQHRDKGHYESQNAQEERVVQVE